MIDSNWDAPIPLVTLDEFLVAEEWAGLLDYTLSRDGEFISTGILDHAGAASIDPDYRRSRVLFEMDAYRSVFADRILTFLPLVLRQLSFPEFPVREIEMQLTATNDGEFFRAHTDNRSDIVNSRTLTFVYYFYRQPKAFAGGELRVFGTQSDMSQAVPGPYRIVYPMQNQIAFFPSDTLHEILPVECPSGQFSDSRFTLNGWLHR